MSSWDSDDERAASSDGGSGAWDSDNGENWDDVGDGADAASSARAALLEILLHLYFNSVMTARHFCIICYYCGRAGLGQMFSNYGLRPGAESGHYQRKLDGLLGFTTMQSKLYALTTYGVRKDTIGRAAQTLLVRPVHEQLQAEIEADPAQGDALDAMKASGKLPPAYHEHCVVQRNADERVWPVALYMDGVPYSITDSVLAVWLVNAVSGKRHLCALVRKRQACRCGCRGWCTYFVLLKYLHWCLQALARKVHPSSRHDGSAWGDADGHHALLAGEAMFARAAMVWLKGDWAELCSRLGFPTWSHAMRPCLCCNGSGDRLYDPRGVSTMSTPWVANGDEDYERACARCEIVVVIPSAEVHARLVSRLQYMKQQGKGRVLRADVEGLPMLRQWDRLEPSDSLYDIGEGFDNLTRFPATVIFWRPDEETLCTHRCPLFDSAIGITPNQSIALDLLHTYYLGVCNVYCKFLLWRMLRSHVWGRFADSRSERFHTSVLCLRASLLRWYKDRAQSHPTENLTRLVDLTVKMLGTESKPKLKTKAAETWGLLLFCNFLLSRHGPAVGPDHQALLAAGEALENVIRILQRQGPRMDNVVIEVCVSFE